MQDSGQKKSAGQWAEDECGTVVWCLVVTANSDRSRCDNEVFGVG